MGPVTWCTAGFILDFEGVPYWEPMLRVGGMHGFCSWRALGEHWYCVALAGVS